MPLGKTPPHALITTPRQRETTPPKLGTLSDRASYPYKVIDHYSFEMEVVETTRFLRSDF